jgi:hypothetical protein
MIKNYKAKALKTSQGTGSDSYEFIIKGIDINQALKNAQSHILNTYSANADYHVNLKLVGNSSQ